MSEVYKTNSLFKLLESLEKEEQRDILAILRNLTIMSQEYQDFFHYQLKLTPLKEEETTKLLEQQNDLKANYELILLDDISIVGEKYLNFLLEYIKAFFSNKSEVTRIDALIDKFVYDKKIKKEISKYIQKDIYSIDEKKINRMNDILLSPKLKYEDNSILSKKFHEKFAFSDTDGEYGVKYLQGESKDTIHIFVNGFTNDSEGNNYKDWLDEAIDILDVEDTLYGYDWASGKKLSKHITQVIPLLARAKGNPILTPLILLSRVRSEWKQARNNSKMYSHDLAIFIEEQLIDKPNIKVNLYGHSLGANLLHHTLKHLYVKELKVNDVFLFGGASEVNKEAWTEALCAATNVYNYYSKNDQILTYLYQSMELTTPIGLSIIEHNQKNKLVLANIHNYNVTDAVAGHTEYIPNFNLLYRWKYR